MITLFVISIMLMGSMNELPDSLIKYVSHSGSIYITSEDILSVDTVDHKIWTFHLSPQKSCEFDSLYFAKGQIFFYVNSSWIRLQEFEIRSSHCPIGYYLRTNLGKIETSGGEINIGYYSPPQKKKMNKFQRKLLYGFIPIILRV